MSRYDLATQGDLLLSHLVAAAAAGDVERLGEVAPGRHARPGRRLGSTATSTRRRWPTSSPRRSPSRASRPSGRSTRSSPTCAGTLGVAEPAVHVRNSPLTRSLRRPAGGRDHLVLTSGLLNLFEGRPEELRFVVGRELGHVKCGHVELRQKAYAILSAVRAIDAAMVPDRTRTCCRRWRRAAVHPVPRGRVLRRPRRAALLRRGQARLRGDHAAAARPAGRQPLDRPRGAKDFDARAVIRSFREWQYQPFVKFVLDIKGQTLDHPYYQERLATLKLRADSGDDRALLGRCRRFVGGEVGQDPGVRDAPQGEACDPYVVVSDGVGQVLRTRYASGVRRERSGRISGRPTGGATSRGRSATASRCSSRSGTPTTPMTRSSGASRCSRGPGMPGRDRTTNDVRGVYGQDPPGLEGPAAGLPPGIRAGLGPIHATDGRRPGAAEGGTRGIDPDSRGSPRRSSASPSSSGVAATDRGRSALPRRTRGGGDERGRSRCRGANPSPAPARRPTRRSTRPGPPTPGGGPLRVRRGGRYPPIGPAALDPARPPRDVRGGHRESACPSPPPFILASRPPMRSTIAER